jgi:hypothetical protein
MTHRRRMIRLLALASLAVAVSAFATDRARVETAKGLTAKNQPSPSATSVPASKPGITDQKPTTAGATAPLYKLDWYSINGGGAIDATSSSYKMGFSAGQSVAGQAGSSSYKLGLGFWYGAGGCLCRHQGDLVENSFIDVQDVLQLIKIAFTNGEDIKDTDCPKTRGDVNASGFVDVQDVLYLIKTAFTNGPNPVNPCGP